MKKKYLLLVLVFQSIFVFSQNNQSNHTKNFIHLKNGTVLYFKGYIEKTEPFLGSSKLKVEGKEYKLSSVQFYKNGSQFFANTYGVASACSELAERIDAGKINIYRNYSTVFVPSAGVGFGGAGGFGGFGGGTTSTKETLYFNRNTSPLQKANYENLALALVDNQESLIQLSLYKKAQKREVLLYVVGTAAMLGGLLTASEKTGKRTTSFNPEKGGFEEVDETRIKPANLTIGLLGLTLNVVNYFVHRNKKKYIKRAMYIYNE